MDDQQLWHLSIKRLNSLHTGISVETEPMMAQLLARYRKTKETLDAVIADIDAAAICRECAGQCCLNGKYRINVLDALARIAAQIQTSADFVQKPICPYGTNAGCTMEAGLRPADCVSFICDAIDQKLSPQARLLIAEQEQILRECIGEASRLTGEQMRMPLLLWAEESIAESKSKKV